jgi:hypothetical protein
MYGMMDLDIDNSIKPPVYKEALVILQLMAKLYQPFGHFHGCGSAGPVRADPVNGGKCYKSI